MHAFCVYRILGFYAFPISFGMKYIDLSLQILLVTCPNYPCILCHLFKDVWLFIIEYFCSRIFCSSFTGSKESSIDTFFGALPSCFISSSILFDLEPAVRSLNHHIDVLNLQPLLIFLHKYLSHLRHPYGYEDTIYDIMNQIYYCFVSYVNYLRIRDNTYILSKNPSYSSSIIFHSPILRPPIRVIFPDS